MKFHILSIDHTWQLQGWHFADIPAVTKTPEGTKHKTLLHGAVRRLLIERGVDLICEECDPRYVSIAQKIAYESSPRIPWRNIYMTSQERLEAGIYEALLDRPYDDVESPPGSGNFQTVHQRIPADDLRERFFADESVRAAKAIDAKSVLILVGDMHTDSLKRKLEELKFEAQANHTLPPGSADPRNA